MAPQPCVLLWGTVCSGQPGALAVIQGGERRGKRRAGEGRGGEPRAQEQRRAPHHPAPRTFPGSRDARAAAWAHKPGHLVPEVSPELPELRGRTPGRRSGRGRRAREDALAQAGVLLRLAARRPGGGGGVPAAVSPEGSQWPDQGDRVSP